MKKVVLAMVMAAAVLTSVGVQGESEPAVQAKSKPTLWLTDYDQAINVAEEQKRPILVDFTGSDWCGWCIRLDKEVFSQEAFLAYAKDNLVLLKLDFPSRKKLPKEEADRNQALAEKFGIQGFPTIVLLGVDGQEKARTGYRPGGAETYVEHLKGLLD